MGTQIRTDRSLRGFFLLVFVLSIPVWLIGGKKLPLSVNLPVSALTAFIPMVAAAILSYRQDRANGVRGLFKKALDYGQIRSKIWYLPALLLAPLIYLLSYVLMRLAGLPLPDRIETPLLRAPVFFVMYFFAGAGEELGWTAYATDPVQSRWKAFSASLLLGIVWAVWHAVPFIQTGNPASWVLWQSLKTVATRVMIVWLYNNTGKSVFAAILFHTTDNVSWSLFPNNGSHYNPFVTGILFMITAGIVSFAWGTKTLARFRFAQSNSETTSADDAADRPAIGYNQRKG